LGQLPMAGGELGRLVDDVPVRTGCPLRVRRDGTRRVQRHPFLDEVVGGPLIEGEVLDEGPVPPAQVHTLFPRLMDVLARQVACDQPGERRPHVAERGPPLPPQVRRSNQLLHRGLGRPAQDLRVPAHRAHVLGKAAVAGGPAVLAGEGVEDLARQAWLAPRPVGKRALFQVNEHDSRVLGIVTPHLPVDLPALVSVEMPVVREELQQPPVVDGEQHRPPCRVFARRGSQGLPHKVVEDFPSCDSLAS
jgi:hypothetical protein